MFLKCSVLIFVHSGHIGHDDDGFFIACKDRKVVSKMAKKSDMHIVE